LELDGQQVQARSHRDQGLRLLDRTGDAKHRHDGMIEAAYVAIGNGHEAVADLYLDTLVANDLAAHNDVTACTSLMWRSAYRYRRQLPSATDDLHEAQAVCHSIADPSVRERALANLELARWALASDTPAGEPLTGLDAAIAYYRRTNSHVWLRTAYFARAQRLGSRGDALGAERDFRAAMDETEAGRGKIDERQARISFTATADEIADGYVEFLLRQHRQQDAFEVADHDRLRELVDSPTARWDAQRAGVLLSSLHATLPLSTALVEYRVLSKSIVAWVVSGKEFAMVTLPTSIAGVKHCLATLGAGASDGAVRASQMFLYDALFRPVAPLLKDSTVIIVVPDDELERIPYCALYDKLQGRYLLETRATVVSPSAALFLQSHARARERLRAEDRIVVLQASSGGATAASLPQAAAEARSIRALYHDARVLDVTGEAGTVLLDRVKDASLLQFIGHTTAEGDRSLRALRFGDAPGSRLGVADIVAAALPNLRLAYLSACETDNGPILKSEGSITIARSFFAAGVPVVVGTLWPVDDEAARLAARTFHEHLRRGDTPAESLRQAQLNLLTHTRSLGGDWAAFRIIGAGV